ncbi:ATP-binding protein [Paenibacillus sp.]|jgi:signal transduction histidine kinase|uniref:sensor histidine kinase n=1 Tax=Paenibacillus sp. TaxID=58172 RepID=UPI002831E4F6|nr:ATP-binding protein [Paenibacillus sp.]MDR0269793.1 HAMP domain-containing histidine kinase [Paenibacillus sp.]
MFRSIRNRLTRDFALMMIGAWVIFDLLSFGVLSSILRQAQVNAITSTLREQIQEMDEGTLTEGLWWITDHEGKVLNRSPEAAFALGRNWNGLGYVLNPGKPKVIESNTTAGKEIHWLFMGDRLQSGDSYLMVAMDISEGHRAIRVWGIASIVLSVIFTAGFAWMAGRMSNRAMQPITEALDKQRQFTADASHELRTPLAVMQSSIDVLRTENSERLDPFSQEVLEDMQQEVTGMSRLISDLLQLARWDVGISLELSTLDGAELIRHTCRRLAPQAALKQIDMTFELAKDLLLPGDRSKLEQLLTILLDNAIRYTPEGGNISFTGFRSEDMVIFCCKDSGPGIPEALHRKVFERFYRAESSRHRSLSTPSGGSGLGLAIAAEITTAHHGTIEVYSPPEGGALFTVKLPGLAVNP